MTKEAEIVSRRGVMAGLAGTALAAGGAAVWALPTGWYDSKVAAVSASWWDRRRWTLATAGSREWTRLLGGAFVLFAGGREILLRLTEVNALPSPGTRGAGPSAPTSRASPASPRMVRCTFGATDTSASRRCLAE